MTRYELAHQYQLDWIAEMEKYGNQFQEGYERNTALMNWVLEYLPDFRKQWEEQHGKLD